MLGAVCGLWLHDCWFSRCRGSDGFFSTLRCVYSKAREDAKPYFRSLPGDEEMIANFYRHREDFERLVKIYREGPFLSNGDRYVFPPPSEVEAIMARINVSVMQGDGQHWVPPDPYSNTARKFIQKLWSARKLFNGGLEDRKYSGVQLSYRHERVHRTCVSWFNIEQPRVWKGYYFTPFVPRKLDGCLRTPGPAYWGLPHLPGMSVFPTLNRYPSDLKNSSCYRQFEPRWFISLEQEIPVIPRR